MLWRDDRLDDVGDIIYIGECLDAKEDVVKGLLRGMCGVLGCSDDCGVLERRCGECLRVHTSIRLEPLIAVQRRSRVSETSKERLICAAHLKEMPY